jgi:uncharacterized membrane protein
MTNTRTKEIALTGVFGAMILVMALVPWLGYIQIGLVSLTIIHIPVLIGGAAGGKRVSIYLGLIFGLSSLMIALMRPVLPSDFVFQNPLVSVLPRILFGYIAYLLYDLFNKKMSNNLVATAISFVLATIAHTIMVLIMFWIFGIENAALSGIFGFIWGILLSNGFFEAILAAIVGAPIANRLYVYLRKE